MNRNVEKQANDMLINTYPGFPHFDYILGANLGVTLARRCFRDVFKELRNEISPVIHIIFDFFFANRPAPKGLDKARVGPLFKKKRLKKRHRKLQANFIACILCQVMKHIVASNLTRPLNENYILYELQYGFREKRSCETQLIQLVDYLGRQLTQGSSRLSLIIL